MTPAAAERSDERRHPPPDLVSVVIPAFNAEGLIGVQLEALAHQDYEGAWEVIVVNNRSTDDTAAVARSFADRFTSLRVIDADDGKGVSYARNCGARAAGGDLVAICDADDRVHPDWLRFMAEASRDYDVIGGYLDAGPLNDELSQIWRVPFPREHLPQQGRRFLPFAIGANVGVRSECVTALGGWREDYVMGGDDIEFSWRAQLAGYKIGMATEAVIDYRYREGLRPLYRQVFSYGLADPLLYRDHRDLGMPRSSMAEALGDWAQLVYRAPLIPFSDRRKGGWVRTLGLRWGRLRGSIRHRCLYL